MDAHVAPAGNRVSLWVHETVAFFRAVRAELDKVTWPTRPELIKATRMIVILSIVLGITIGLMDYALQLILVGAILALNSARTFPDEDLVRPQDYLISLQGYLSRGMKAQALTEAETGRRLFGALPEFHKAAARLYLEQGRKAEAQAAYRDVLARDPSDAEARRQVMLLTSSP